MYNPPFSKSKDRNHALELMRAYPFASLISTDDAGTPFVSHLPLHAQETATEMQQETVIHLLGHCAKANPHWKYLQTRPEAVVIFMGPQAYLSPKVYPDAARVPTWNYLAVHCKVRARIIQNPADKDVLLKALIADHEPAYAAQWRSLDSDFTEKMLAGIVGFELEIHDFECKLKLNQHRPESHAAMREVYAQGDAQMHALLAWMDKLGM